MADDQPARPWARQLGRNVWELPTSIVRVAPPALVWVVTLCLLMSLVPATSWLPGVGNQLNRPILILLLVYLATVCGLVALGLARLQARTWAGASRLCLRHLRLLLTGLGVLSSPGRAWRLAGSGILGALVVMAVASWLVTNVPFSPTVGEDPRRVAVEHAPQWATALTYAAYGPWEEWLWRSPLLLAVTRLLTPDRSGRRLLVSWCAIGLLTLITSGIFGWAHLEFSSSNAATATAGGLIYATLVIITRSLWPAIIAHSLSNIIVTWSW